MRPPPRCRPCRLARCQARTTPRSDRVATRRPCVRSARPQGGHASTCAHVRGRARPLRCVGRSESRSPRPGSLRAYRLLGTARSPLRDTERGLRSSDHPRDGSAPRERARAIDPAARRAGSDPHARQVFSPRLDSIASGPHSHSSPPCGNRGGTVLARRYLPRWPPSGQNDSDIRPFPDGWFARWAAANYLARPARTGQRELLKPIPGGSPE